MVGVTAHVAAFFHPRGWTWGVHVYAFWPWVALAAATAALAVCLALPALAGRTPRRDAAASAPALPAWASVALALGAGIVFWLFRARHALLGDGLTILAQPAGGIPLHPLEPLSAMIAALVRRVSPADAAGPLATMEAAWRSAALTSCLAGVVFVPVAVGIAQELARIGRPVESTPAPRGLVMLIAVALIAQGYAQLFFGYVENYALATLGVALYLLAALRTLRGAGSLWSSGMALALAVALHLGAAASAPSFLVLAGAGLARPQTRARARRDLLLLAGVVAVALVAVAWVTHGYNLAGQLARTTLDVLRGDTSFRPGYRGSLEHLLDFLNGQALAGPLAAFLFVPVAAMLAFRRGGRTATEWFLLTAGGVTLAAAALAGDSNLGYARNWDLMAPYAFVLTACGLGLLLARVRLGRSPRWVLPALAALSLYHTLPWVALNHSLERSIERFATLPLGLGRVESTLGYWYAIHGQVDEAERWQVRALDENPGNLRALLGLSTIYRSRGDATSEVMALREAVRLRPADERTRWRLLDALVRAHDFGAAEAEAGHLASLHPGDASLGLARAVVLALAGRAADASRALDEVEVASPGDSELRRLIADARAAIGHAGVLEQLWEREFGVPATLMP